MGQILQVQMSVSNLSYDFRLQLLFRTLKKATFKYNLNEKWIKVTGPIRFILAMGQYNEY